MEDKKSEYRYFYVVYSFGGRGDFSGGKVTLATLSKGFPKLKELNELCIERMATKLRMNVANVKSQISVIFVENIIELNEEDFERFVSE